MLRRLADLPLLVLLMGLTALSMWLPAAQAVVSREHEVGRAFFYSGFILLVLTAMIGIATAARRPRDPARANLVALVASYAVLPVLMALPMVQAMPELTVADAWFEMISAFTTTGMTQFDRPWRVPDAVHLWRAQVGWMGGFLILVSAVAVLAPMNLGGVEVISGRVPGRGTEGLGQITRIADPARRVVRQALALFPVYGGLTLGLWVCLTLSGDESLVALCHAMAAISTSGISPLTSLSAGQSGIAGEFFVLVVMLAALSRRLWPGAALSDARDGLGRDPELRLALALVLFVTAILVLRHWIAAGTGGDIGDALGALWGAVFTTLSFLTTTGFISTEWETARTWSGLDTPGLVLAGLAIIGGGIATTAGGVKLLRVYALFRHGERELERLIHPNSVGGSGQSARRLRREGAYVAWVFFMLFALSIAAFVAALTLLAMPFEDALILTLAALTTTGPLAQVAAEAPLPLSEVGPWARAVLGLAMVVGRLETLAILALMAPDSWRR